MQVLIVFGLYKVINQYWEQLIKCTLGMPLNLWIRLIFQHDIQVLQAYRVLFWWRRKKFHFAKLFLGTLSKEKDKSSISSASVNKTWKMLSVTFFLINTLKGKKVFSQIIGIPIGSDSASFFANMFLYYCLYYYILYYYASR